MSANVPALSQENRRFLSCHGQINCKSFPQSNGCRVARPRSRCPDPTPPRVSRRFRVGPIASASLRLRVTAPLSASGLSANAENRYHQRKFGVHGANPVAAIHWQKEAIMRERCSGPMIMVAVAAAAAVISVSVDRTQAQAPPPPYPPPLAGEGRVG